MGTRSRAFVGAALVTGLCPVAADTLIPSGNIVCRDASGNAVVGDEDTSLVCLGISQAEADNTGGSAGDKAVLYEAGATRLDNSTAGDEITKADVGNVAYIVDGGTVAKTDGSATRAPAGIIVDVLDSGEVVVFVGVIPARIAASYDLASGAIGVVKRTVTITQADDLAGLGAGVKTLTKALGGGALPASAHFLGVVVGSGSPTMFDDATHGTYSIKVGSASDDDGIISAVNVAAGQTGFPKAGTAGVRAFAMAPLYAETTNAILTSSVDLNTATQGTVTIDLFYLVKA